MIYEPLWQCSFTKSEVSPMGLKPAGHSAFLNPGLKPGAIYRGILSFVCCRKKSIQVSYPVNEKQCVMYFYIEIYFKLFTLTYLFLKFYQIHLYGDYRSVFFSVLLIFAIIREQTRCIDITIVLAYQGDR